MLPSDKGSDTQTTRVHQGSTEGQGRLLGERTPLVFQSPQCWGTGDRTRNFAKMPMLLLSADSLGLVISIPASLDLPGGRSTRMTFGTERVTTSSETNAAACIHSPKAGRVKFLWDARGRPQLRRSHARPCGQAPTNHCGAYTKSSQSAPVLFPSPARSSPGSPNPVPAPAFAAVAAATFGADSGSPVPGSLRCLRSPSLKMSPCAAARLPSGDPQRTFI